MQKQNDNHEVQPVESSQAERTSERRVLQPRCDIWEDEANVTLIADMPGVAPDGLEVTLEDNVLTVRGRATPPRIEGWSLRYAEYELGDYERSFVLSERADAERISAELRNGRLTVTVPKLQPTRKKIAVRAG